MRSAHGAVLDVTAQSFILLEVLNDHSNNGAIATCVDTPCVVLFSWNRIRPQITHNETSGTHWHKKYPQKDAQCPFFMIYLKFYQVVILEKILYNAIKYLTHITGSLLDILEVPVQFNLNNGQGMA